MRCVLFGLDWKANMTNRYTPPPDSFHSTDRMAASANEELYAVAGDDI